MTFKQWEEWQRWRGSTEERMKSAEEKLCEQDEKLAELQNAVSAVLQKIAVPLFFVSIGGVVLGGIVVALVGKLLTK